MKLYMKVGTESASYCDDVRGNYYSDEGRDELDRPLELKKPPKVGDQISWQEMLNGPWMTGMVDGIDGDLFLVARF